MALSIKLLIVFLILVLYKSTNNLWQWLQLAFNKKIYLNCYDTAIKMNSKEKNTASDKEAEERALQKIREKKLTIISLFEKAGLKRPTITVTKPTGYNHVQSVPIDIFDNLEVMKTEAGTNIPAVILGCFDMSIGVYKQRVIDAIDIFWWANLLIFLPTKLVAYLGYPTESSKIKFFVRVIDVAYWFMASRYFYYLLS